MKIVAVIVILCSIVTILHGEEDRECDAESHVCVHREDCDFYQQNVVKISKSRIIAEVSFLKLHVFNVSKKYTIHHTCSAIQRKPFSEK